MVDRDRGAPAIRIVATILISLLVAIAVATLLYTVVLAIGRDPLPAADTALQPPKIERLSAPSHLDAYVDEQGDAPPAFAPNAPRRLVTLPIQVVDAPRDLREGTGGVATFDEVGGGEFRWYPLDEAIDGQDGSLLVTAEAELGARLSITFAATSDQARHGYLSRRDLLIESPDGRSAPLVSVRGDVHTVRFDLPTDAERAEPLRVRRADDPQWLPMLHGTSGMNLKRGSNTELLLGPGDYVLQDPLEPTRSQSFQVPGTSAVTLSRDLAPTRSARR